MHIVIADPLHASATDLLRIVAGWTVDERPGRSPEELKADLQEADALIIRSATRVDAALIGAAPRLRVIARAGTGVDNVDIDAANQRGILVMNAPGANSVSVAEHACALIMALARSLPAADAAMKEGKWDKRRFMGEELRGKTLGVVGLGRIGQEVVRQAHGFGMRVIAHDPFIASQVAEDLDVSLVSLDDLCAEADYLTLHLPATSTTRHLFNASRLGQCKAGARLINTARGDLVDERALADALERGHLAGAGLDVFENEPPLDSRLVKLPQVIATPHIAASTREAQERVGIETVAAVRDFLQDGIVRNAVNFPSVSADEFKRIQPFLVLGERLGILAASIGEGRTQRLEVRYFGELASGHTELLMNAVLVGLFKPLLSSAVTPVNARATAAGRGIEIIESRSSRPRDYTSLLSVKLYTDLGETWVEGTVFHRTSLRIVTLAGIEVEAPLEGTLLVIKNTDQPGVIGHVGTILGRHGVNIASFALGRGTEGAVGLVNIDEPWLEENVLKEIRDLAAVRAVTLVRL